MHEPLAISPPAPPLRRTRPLTVAARRAQLEAQRRTLAGYIPFQLLPEDLRHRPGLARGAQPQPLRVAVIGAGFAGLAAAYALQRSGFQVIIYEARASVGGRVSSTRELIPGRTIERGAELIGSNHHLWLDLARAFGLGLTLITDPEEYGKQKLDHPLVVGGRRLGQAEARQLYSQMDVVLERLTTEAAAAVGPPFVSRPWEARQAQSLDTQTLGEWLAPHAAPGRLREALEFEFTNDMTAPPTEQSLLGIFTQIAAGGRELYGTRRKSTDARTAMSRSPTVCCMPSRAMPRDLNPRYSAATRRSPRSMWTHGAW